MSIQTYFVYKVHLVGRTLQSNEVYQQNQVASLGAPDEFLQHLKDNKHIYTT